MSTIPQILSYGGGRQTVALCLLIAKGLIPKPDRIVIADTGREKRSTWEYADAYTRPMMREHGLEIEVAPHVLATVDMYSKKRADLLIPAYTATGKLSAFCSNEWKTRVVHRYLNSTGTDGACQWIGFTVDESKRIKDRKARRASLDGEDAPEKWTDRYPLCELMLTKENCRSAIERHGWPLPPPSSCWMCPNMGNVEWKEIRANRPDEFEQACKLDEEIREEDLASGGSGVWLHASRVPLRAADLDAIDRREPSRQCGFGTCFI
jgi:3'-phosphoadenosine 5'-phosphosulfate sulfotransferase (PAPS reductase)/FAD synthetase